MAIRIYDDKIRFVADSDGDVDIDLVIESDGLRFTKPLTTAYNVAYTGPPQLPPPAQGTVAGFSSGGFDGSPTTYNQIEKFPFSISGGTATDVGDLSTSNRNAGSESSSTDGFTMAGQTTPPSNIVGTIDKFPFSISGGTATDVGDLSQVRLLARGHVTSSNVFASGGTAPPQVSTIDKFPFNISSGTATDVGDLNFARYNHASHSSSTDGFASGGFTSPPFTRHSQIDKFPFSISGGTATDVGDLSLARSGSGGHSSPSDAFVSGGTSATPATVSQIDFFPFSISSGTATDIGDLSVTREVMASHSTTSDAFVSGGYITTPPFRASGIDKYPFSVSPATATDVGDLNFARSNLMGYQD
jgi:hypothetical protein